jgi:hypothetical protein
MIRIDGLETEEMSMAGILVPLMPKRTLDFTNNLASTLHNVVIQERIDVSDWIEGILVVRAHSANLAAGSISFSLIGDGWTTEDQAPVFYGTSPLFSSVFSPTAGPALAVGGGTLPGKYVALIATGFRTTGGSVIATLSVDLVLRSPDS